MRALLVGITTKYDRYDIDYSLNELKNLAETLDYEIIDYVTQSLDRPNATSYIGKGKLSEIAIMIHALDIESVIFNDELSPAQLRNISNELNIEVIDRSYLILKIFDMRASSKGAKLEIKLARDLYLLPRISSFHENQSRIGGGASTKTRGAGETQKELDRRHIMSEINHLKQEIEKEKKQKINQISKYKKNEIPIVALVGYTNAGKSTTMNTILDYVGANQDKQVFAKDQLFATLSTYNRKITYNKTDFMLVDTIGFVSKLPHNLIGSFYQTLQEVKNADLIIHVADASSEYIGNQLNVVTEVLYSLECEKIPSIYLLNKWDKTISNNMDIPGKKTIRYSNYTKDGLEELLTTITEEIGKSSIHAKILIPYSKGDIINIIEEKAIINTRDYQEKGIYYDIDIPSKLYHLIREYDLDIMVN
ncbi:MAG: GTPase HflX [Acholeplasmatales bacterium]|nr:GTPase HflX [Acholeplasmatales bacterium]